MTSSRNNLFVKNLDNHLDDDDLEMMFDWYGDIVSAAKVAVDAFGQSKGFGFVCFKRGRDAQEAIRYGPKYLMNYGKAFTIGH